MEHLFTVEGTTAVGICKQERRSRRLYDQPPLGLRNKIKRVLHPRGDRAFGKAEEAGEEGGVCLAFGQKQHKVLVA